VTLVDGTEFTFLVKPKSHKEWGWIDYHGAYLTRDFTSYTARPFALRMDRKIAFETGGGQLADLALQIFRGDGLLQVAVAMDHTLIRQ
jgi:hypothetical protein